MSDLTMCYQPDASDVLITNIFQQYFSKGCPQIIVDLNQIYIEIEKNKIHFNVKFLGEANQKYNGKWMFEFQYQSLFREDVKVVDDSEKDLFICLYALMLKRINEKKVTPMGRKKC